MPEKSRHDLAALRVCRDCGALGRINSQGVVVLEANAVSP
jgi:hypothetical protein